MYKVVNSKSNYKTISKEDNVTTICWDYDEIFENETEWSHGKEILTGNKIPSGNAAWYQLQLPRSINTPAETVNYIKEEIDSYIKSNIVSGFKWKGHTVILSETNQANYKASYDLAYQTGGQNLPVKVKFKDYGNDVIYEFLTVEELQEFYIAVNKHINKWLEIGWTQKSKLKIEDYII